MVVFKICGVISTEAEANEIRLISKVAMTGFHIRELQQRVN